MSDKNEVGILFFFCWIQQMRENQRTHAKPKLQPSLQAQKEFAPILLLNIHFIRQRSAARQALHFVLPPSVDMEVKIS
jgi:hypothetical protein